MLRIIRIFFISMGIVFTLVLVGFAYVVIADPFHIRPIVTLLMHSSGVTTTPVPSVAKEPVRQDTATISATTSITTSDPAPGSVLNGAPTPDQRAALESVGINPDTVMEGVSAAQLECFVRILGAVRVAAIQAGAVPSAAEFMSVRSCL